jgi:hypothetical protein
VFSAFRKELRRIAKTLSGESDRYVLQRLARSPLDVLFRPHLAAETQSENPTGRGRPRRVLGLDQVRSVFYRDLVLSLEGAGGPTPILRRVLESFFQATFGVTPDHARRWAEELLALISAAELDRAVLSATADELERARRVVDVCVDCGRALLNIISETHGLRPIALPDMPHIRAIAVPMMVRAAARCPDLEQRLTRLRTALAAQLVLLQATPKQWRPFIRPDFSERIQQLPLQEREALLADLARVASEHPREAALAQAA